MAAAEGTAARVRCTSDRQWRLPTLTATPCPGSLPPSAVHSEDPVPSRTRRVLAAEPCVTPRVCTQAIMSTSAIEGTAAANASEPVDGVCKHRLATFCQQPAVVLYCSRAGCRSRHRCRVVRPMCRRLAQCTEDDYVGVVACVVAALSRVWAVICASVCGVVKTFQNSAV